MSQRNGTRANACMGAKHEEGERVQPDVLVTFSDGSTAHLCEECALQLNAVAQDVRAPLLLERIR